jgi:hypothetical protein
MLNDRDYDRGPGQSFLKPLANCQTVEVNGASFTGSIERQRPKPTRNEYLVKRYQG